MKGVLTPPPMRPDCVPELKRLSPSRLPISHGHHQPLIIQPRLAKEVWKTPKSLTIAMRSSRLTESSCPSWCWSAASHGHWSLPRQGRSHVVQMYRHRLYFNPSIAGLDALAISQPKHEGKGLRLALSAFPMEYGLRATGPSFSILANSRGLPRSITFPWLFLFNWEQPCSFLEWNYSTGSHWPGRCGHSMCGWPHATNLNKNNCFPIREKGNPT